MIGGFGESDTVCGHCGLRFSERQRTAKHENAMEAKASHPELCFKRRCPHVAPFFGVCRSVALTLPRKNTILGGRVLLLP